MPRIRIWLIAAALVAFLTPSASWAITIVRNFVAAGGTFPGGAGTATAQPGNAVGAGTLITVFNAAADVWESALQDTHTVTLNFGWQGLSSGTLGVHSLVSQGGTPNRETAGVVRFDSDGSSVFYMDDTPHNHSEWTTYTVTQANLGGGSMNVGRVFTGATGLAAGRHDLFSIALHEIGHSLGLSSANDSFTAGNGDLDVDVTAPRPFPGSEIPTVSGAHIDLTTALMFPSIGSGIRRLTSAADIIANAEISQFTEINLAPLGVPVPEPTTYALMGAGLVSATLFWQRRRCIQRRLLESEIR